MEFCKAKLLNVQYFPQRKVCKPFYTRNANAAVVDFGLIAVSWRMPWLPEAAYAKGWDACFRQLGGR